MIAKGMEDTKERWRERKGWRETETGRDIERYRPRDIQPYNKRKRETETQERDTYKQKERREERRKRHCEQNTYNET